MTNDQPRSLQDLALIAKNRHGGGGRKLSRIAREHEHSITNTTLDSMIAGTYVSRPTKGTLEALAYLSGEPVKTVYKLAGIPYNEVKVADQLPSGVDELGKDERETLMVVARTLLRQTRDTHSLRLELEAQAARKDRPMSNEDKAAEVVATMAEVAGIEQRPTMEETLAALPEKDNLRNSTEDIVRLILAGEPSAEGVEDPLRADVPEDGGAEVYQFPPSRWDDPKDAAADDAHGLSGGQRQARDIDEAGEGSQDPGEES